MRYAFIQNGTVTEIQEITDPSRIGKPDMLKSIVRVGYEPFDPTTQDREGPRGIVGDVDTGDQQYYTINLTDVTETYTVRDKVEVNRDSLANPTTYDPNVHDRTGPVIEKTATEYREVYTVSDKPLADVQAWKIGEIKAAAQAEVNKGLTSMALGAEYKYDTDKDRDQINIAGAAQFAEITGMNVEFTATEIATGIKTKRLHTPAQMKQVFIDGAVLVQTVTQQAQNLIGQTLAATTVDEVKAVVWV